jgi:hypothetical protein
MLSALQKPCDKDSCHVYLTDKECQATLVQGYKVNLF